jgi:hypothetical protein
VLHDLAGGGGVASHNTAPCGPVRMRACVHAGASLGRLALERGVVKREYITKTEKFYDK